MKQIKQTIIKKIFTFVIIAIVFFIIGIGCVMAFNYLKANTKDEVLLADCGNLKLEVVWNSGNNKDKKLLASNISNLSPSHFTHIISIEEKVSLISNKCPIETDVFLKISDKQFDSEGTIDNPDKYFVSELEIKNNNNIEKYDDAKKPKFNLDDNKNGTMFVIFTIKQIQELPKEALISTKNPKLFLTCQYEIVDANGKVIVSGSQSSRV